MGGLICKDLFVDACGGSLQCLTVCIDGGAWVGVYSCETLSSLARCCD